MNQLHEIMGLLFSKMDETFYHHYNYKNCFDLNRFTIKDLNLQPLGIHIYKQLNIYFYDKIVIPGEESLDFDELGGKLDVQEGTTIIPIQIKIEPNQEGHANVMLIRKDKNEISTIYIEPHGRYKKEGVKIKNKILEDFMNEHLAFYKFVAMGFDVYNDIDKYNEMKKWIDDDFPLNFTNTKLIQQVKMAEMLSTKVPKMKKNKVENMKAIFNKYLYTKVDMQEVLRYQLENMINQTYPNAKTNHFGIHSKIRVQHDDTIGYCMTISQLVSFFSYLINNCNPKYCEKVSNKHYIETMIKMLLQFSKENINQFKYNKLNSVFCSGGGFLCQFNIFFFCFLLFENLITEKECIPVLQNKKLKLDFQEAIKLMKHATHFI